MLVRLVDRVDATAPAPPGLPGCRRPPHVRPAQFRSGTGAKAAGDLVGEIRAFLAAGMDGFFTDNRDLGVAAG